MNIEMIFDERVGTDVLALFPGDPTALYVYWDITQERKQMVEQFFRCEWHVLPKILRVYDVSFVEFHGNNANGYFDIGLNGSSDNWFIKEVKPNCSYCVDYGTTTLDGRFFTILRSNAVKTPPQEPQTGSNDQVYKVNVQQNCFEPEWMDRFTGYSLKSV